MQNADTGMVERVAATLPRDARILVEGGAAASRALAAAAVSAGPMLGAAIFTGVQVPGINRDEWLGGEDSRFETFFMTPELAALRGRVDFLPLSYTQILQRLRHRPPVAAMFSVSPPDANGACSFGPTVDFIAELWPSIPLRIGHVNPLIPRTAGGATITIDQFDVVFDGAQPLVTVAEPTPDPCTDAIAANVAALIGDGATLQTGLGKLPGAVLRALTDRRHLAIHSGLIGDGVLDLLESGAVPSGAAVTAGVAIGGQRLYDALPDSGIQFRPVSHTHDWTTIARIPRFVAINSAIEVDLLGQAFSEVVAGGWSSGTGGVTDFAHGAALGGGLRIVALPAIARGSTRIVAASVARGPVTLSRTDTDIVVTENGAADLRGLTHDQRAAALIAIADPAHRENLARAWRDGPGSY